MKPNDQISGPGVESVLDSMKKKDLGAEMRGFASVGSSIFAYEDQHPIRMFFIKLVAPFVGPPYELFQALKDRLRR